MSQPAPPPSMILSFTNNVSTLYLACSPRHRDIGHTQIEGVQNARQVSWRIRPNTRNRPFPARSRSFFLLPGGDYPRFPPRIDRAGEKYHPVHWGRHGIRAGQGSAHDSPASATATAHGHKVSNGV